jgi:lipopolysaccharide transport system ATP-binding protein
MKKLAIKAEHISKQYRLGQIGTGTLSHDLNRFWHKLRGKPDPYLKIGEQNDRSKKGESEYVWSLKDINFEIEQGDAVGIIGRNGAGKSTLLKILSKVTQPTTGSIKVNGRIASLLEVGTGFHPEMTGRENIYMNGAILGMRKKEIDRKLDEIIDFSGVERYIDTPVKRYSSGMYVRLAFAVAAHLESEILIVDEVLAVGDAEFQKKCLGKMGEVSKGEGRTVLFVSHDMGAISKLCEKSLLLTNGKLFSIGSTNLILNHYLSENISSQYNCTTKEKENHQIYLAAARILHQKYKQDFLELNLIIQSEIVADINVDFRLFSANHSPIGFSSLLNDDLTTLSVKKGENIFRCKMYVGYLAIGRYNISIDITKPNVLYYDRNELCLQFELTNQTIRNNQIKLEWNYGFIQLQTTLC